MPLTPNVNKGFALDIPMDEEGTMKQRKMKRFEELKKRKIEEMEKRKRDHSNNGGGRG